jgi:RNA polymerase sigma-70 factor (ECF subfamily)
MITAEWEALRPGLVGYCYRMLGSVFEADDAAQETLVRAWQAEGSFEGRASVRTWVYRIATNVCTDVLRGRARRAVPMDLRPASTVETAAHTSPDGQPWLTPFPDPAENAVEKDSVRLAFVAALQYLPPRQRAVLILRDALAWPAAEVAELLDTSVASVNSALQRARATLATRSPAEPAPLGEKERRLLAEYVESFERYDIAKLVTLLHEDAVQNMPPFPFWFHGRDEICRWMLGPGAGCRGSRALLTSANGTPALAQYRPSPGGGHQPFALTLLDLREGRIAGLHTFLGDELFSRFSLPDSL